MGLGGCAYLSLREPFQRFDWPVEFFLNPTAKAVSYHPFLPFLLSSLFSYLYEKAKKAMVAVENMAEYLLAQIKTQDVVCVPASEAEYLDIASEFPGKLEYHNGEIIAMSLATALHELILSSINYLLFAYYRDKDFLITSSNAGLQIPRPGGGYYQPDLMVTQGDWIFKQGSNCIITNPYLLVEVLSPSTMKYDQEYKLEYYKELPSLNYVVYAAQNRPYLTIYERTDQPDVWLNTDYKTLDSVAKLGDLTLPLREVYHKIQFPQTV